MERAADRPRHRDMAGDHQVERQASYLEVGQRRVELRTCSDQRADQIVGRLAFAALDRLEEVTLQRDRSLCVSQPLLHRAVLLNENPVVAPDVQPRQIFAREAEQLAEHAQRERPGKGPDQIDLAGGRQRVEKFVDDAPDDRFERSNPSRREGLRHEPADSVVERRVDLDDVRHLAVSLREHRRHLFGKRRAADFSAPVDENVS